MDKDKLLNIWNYFLSIEKDMSDTSQYIEPLGQEETFSFAFYKIIVLACMETENIFKIISKNISGVERGNISEYKEDILKKYPKIVESEVYVERLGQLIKPFELWSERRLFWWDSYSQLKHNRKKDFNMATYKNAVYSLAGLYILILYSEKIFNIQGIDDSKSIYLTSEYSMQKLYCQPNSILPDF